MRNSKKTNPRRADAREPEYDVIRPGEDDGIDLAFFAPPTQPEDEDEDIQIYQNFSNGYGKKVRNYSNNYGDPDGEPVKQAPGRQGSIPAYNQDFHREKTRHTAHRGEYRDYGADRQPVIPDRKEEPRRRGCCGCGCTTVLMLLAALVLGGMILLGALFEMPRAEEGLGQRKADTATVLLCGTDKDGTRTDTMMLMYLDGGEGQIGLLSLPRDTLTITDAGKRAKLNSAYGRNGCGEEGMDWTLTYVERTIGYRPDGYILVDMELVPKIADLMGGVDFHLDQEIWVRNIEGELLHIPEGDQHLNGEEVLGTLRYRSGYSNADLGRVEVQRRVISECMKQWVNPAKLALLPDALNMVQEQSMTNLSVSNFLWIGKTILLGMDNMTSDTLPGYPDMRGGASYYVLYPDQVADLVNQSYNPYTVDVDVDDLQIAR